MKIIFKLILITVLFIPNCFGNNPSAKSVEVKNLVTEYKTNPIGIDVEKPRLSWKIISTEKNIIQTAYQIQVAKSKEDLKKGKNLLWDSKKVTSEQSIQLIYDGEKIASGQRVYWQVKVWTNTTTSKWTSGNDFWEKGIETNDWQAKWISPKQVVDSSTVEANPYLRKDFKLSKKIKSATLYVTALGLYEVFINGEKVSDDLFTPGWTSYKKRLQYQT
ncbi:MAG: alpha-L-rhamnosidase N-terminal domain-containing protein, partial [Flavobacteriales bacterium]|nr:alpha-L-rhamnosidase N-terminal domain-containing protein [Flavobacteriales bacterium]